MSGSMLIGGGVMRSGTYRVHALGTKGGNSFVSSLPIKRRNRTSGLPGIFPPPSLGGGDMRLWRKYDKAHPVEFWWCSGRVPKVLWWRPGMLFWRCVSAVSR